MVSTTFIYSYAIISIIIIVLFFGLLFFFGKLIWLQMRIWILASRGYVQVENIGEDKVRRYYYLRPKNNKFDIKKGFYLFFPETMTKTTILLKKIDPDMLVKQPEYYDTLFDRLPKGEQDKFKKKAEAEKKQYMELYSYISKLVYNVDAVTLRWGIPTVTYYGTDPNPVLFSDRKKVYDAGVLNDMYLRILLTQKYSVFKKWMIITVIALAIIAILIFAIFSTLSNQAKTIKACIYELNDTTNKLLTCVNETATTQAKIESQNRTIVI